MTGTPIDLAKLRSIGYLGRGRTRDRVADVRSSEGKLIGRATTDQLNNTVTVRDDGQDVHIRAPHLKVKFGETQEIR